MKRPIVLLILFFTLTAISSAQTRFEKTYGGAKSDAGKALWQMKDGGFMLAGTVADKNPPIYQTYGYLIRTDQNGETIWSKKLDNATNITHSSIEDIYQLPNGDFLLLMISSNTDTSFTVIAKMDSLANFYWTKTYPGNPLEVYGGIDTAVDGGYIFLSQIYNDKNSGKTYVLKTDVNGDTLWTRIFDDYAHCLKTTSGGYVICGGPGVFSHSHYFMMKIDQNGDEVWNGVRGNTYFLNATYLEEIDDGFIMVLIRRTHPNITLIKTDKDGEILWEKVHSGNNVAVATSVKPTSDGGFIILGLTQDQNDNAVHYLLKTDSEGNKEWDRMYGDRGLDHKRCLILTSDGGYAFLANTHVNLEANYFYFVKTDSLERVLSTNKAARIDAKLYPNPTTGILTVEGENVSLEGVYNVLGKKMTIAENEIMANTDAIQIKVSTLPSGTYFILLRSDKGLLAGSFIKQ